MNKPICFIDSSCLEVVSDTYRFGLHVDDEPSWFTVTPDGQSASGILTDPVFIQAILAICKAATRPTAEREK